MRSRVGAGAGSALVQRADAPPEAPPRFRARCRRWSGPGRGPGRGFRARPPRPRPRRPPALDCSCLAAAAWRRGRPRRWRPWWRSAQPSTLRSCCASEPSERGGGRQGCGDARGGRPLGRRRAARLLRARPWGLVGRRTGGAPGPRARPPGPGRGTGERGPSSASRPGPAPPPGLAASGAAGDAVTQPRGRGEGVRGPRRPDRGPGPARFVRRRWLWKARLPGRPCPVEAQRSGRRGAGGAPVVQLTGRRARLSGVGSRRPPSARVWDACLQLSGRPGTQTGGGRGDSAGSACRPGFRGGSAPGGRRAREPSEGRVGAREAAPAPPLASPGAPGQVSDRASVSPEAT